MTKEARVVLSGDDAQTPRLSPDDTLVAELEIGMPHTGQNNLAEGPLLRELGNLRWQHVSRVLGVPSREVADAEGSRLYATFFYIDVAFPPSRPMSSFGENDRLSIASTLRRSGVFLHGEHYLQCEPGPTPTSLDDAVARGIPCVRTANSFVRQWKGADWLKKGVPAQKDRFEAIPSASFDDVLETIGAVKTGGDFGTPPADAVALVRDAAIAYEIVPERDLNGAGLLYFANYPVIVDVCERRALLGALGETDESWALLAGRTIVRRKSAYYSNATYRDRLRVSVDVRAVTSPAAEGRWDHRLFVRTRMRRDSDDRLMYVAWAEKLVAGAQTALRV